MSIELIYKTKDREALRWWRELEAERAAVMERRDAYEAKALSMLGQSHVRATLSTDA